LLENAKSGQFAMDKNNRIKRIANIVLNCQKISVNIAKEEMKILSLKHPLILSRLLRALLGIEFNEKTLNFD